MLNANILKIAMRLKTPRDATNFIENAPNTKDSNELKNSFGLESSSQILYIANK